MTIENKKYTFKTKPFKHQMQALLNSAGKVNFAYFMEMGCVDGETEFLSNRGWVKFKDFDLNEWERPLLVAQAIPPKKSERFIDWSMEFVEPEAYIEKPAYKWMHLCGRKSRSAKRTSGFAFDIYTTNDHVIPVEYSGMPYESSARRKVPNQTYRILDCTAEYCYRSFKRDKTRTPLYPDWSVTLRVPAAICKKFIGFNSNYYKPDPDLSTLNEWEMRFMVACMADGTFPNKRDNKVDFYFTKERKCKRLEYLAMRAGIPLAKEKIKGMRKYTYVYHAIAPLKCKVYDERFYTLPAEALKWITTECFLWDGSVLSDCAHFYTVFEESADFIQYALTACGWEANIDYHGPKKLYTVTSRFIRLHDRDMLSQIEYKDDLFIAEDKPVTSFHKYGHDILSAVPIEEERTAYCFRVPSGYLLLRRDKNIFISGNSGKTKVMIDNIGVLHKKGHITGALVLAPKGVYRNWSDKEIPTHLPDDIERELLVWDAASSDSKKDKLQKQIRDWDGKTLQIMVFNIESLISEKGRKLIVDFIKRHDGNIFALVDESTCIKNYKAKRTKAAIEIGKKCKVRRIATGSPITNSPLDLFSQCAFLDKSLLGCGSYYSFKNSYADIEKIQNRQGYSYEKILRYKNLDRLSNLLDKFSYRVTKKECLDLPDKVYITRDVELTDEQRKVYQEMYDYQFALLNDNKEGIQEMSAQIILTKFLRLHQILCGSFMSDDGKCIRLPNKRLEALKEILDETSGKAIIWATYLDNLKEIEEMLKETYGENSFVTYYGEVSSEDRSKAITLFQDESSPVRFFLGNVQTAGRGITLTAAHTVIYYSNNFSLELRQQSEDRAHRLGQKNKVTYIDLVVRGSLDEKIIKSLIEKRNIANEVLKDDLDSWISLQKS